MITWKISALDRDTATDRATNAHWRATGTDLETTGSTYGVISIAKYAENTPYDSINETMAIAWTKAALGKNEVDAIAERINQQIKDQIAPKTETGTPWS